MGGPFNIGNLPGSVGGSGLNFNPGLGVGGSDISGLFEDLGSILGIGGKSASSLANNAAKEQAYQAEVTKAEEEIRASTNLTEQEKANRAVEGEQRLAEGASGFGVSSGSPLFAQFAQYASDKFKDSVAVFNGLVNAQADQAAAINASAQGAAAAGADTTSALQGDISMAYAAYSSGLLSKVASWI